MPKPLKAFSVRGEEHGEIIFAAHNITAARIGANALGYDDITAVTCRRAPWADIHADTQQVPASLMVEHGWYFDGCWHCGRKISEDLTEWQEIAYGKPFREALAIGRKYRKWSPSSVVGYHHGAIFCDAACQCSYEAEQLAIEQAKQATLGRLTRLVKRRMPDAELIPDRHHVHIEFQSTTGRMKLRQAIIAFSYPGMVYGAANFFYLTRNTQKRRSFGFTCCAGDKEAYIAWVRAQKAKRAICA